MRRTARRLVLLACMVLPVLAWAQPELAQKLGRTVADTGAPGYRFEQFGLASADGQRHYRVRVALPTAAPPAGGHPVAYLLDGNAALMATDAAMLQRLSTSPRPPVIVYIGYDNALRIDADARAYDYTPRRPGGEDVQLDVIGGRRNGGAAAFLDLVEAEVVPRVEARAPVDASRRVLWGHSYGGLFALHVLFTRPRAFSTYAAADPSLWWGNGQLLREEAAAGHWPAPAPQLWLWAGQAAPDDARAPPPGRDPTAVAAMRQARASVPADATPRMAGRLAARGVGVDFEPLPGLSHGQTLGASLPRLLERLAASPSQP